VHGTGAARGPAASRSRRSRASRTAVTRWSAWLGIALVTAAVAFGVAHDRSWPGAGEAAGVARVEQALIALGLGIDEVSISGHRYTPDSDIFDALDLANVTTMAAFDGPAVHARLLRLPWIAQATISRVYPGRIDIAVTERTASAVWLDGGRATLVDATGRRLGAVRPGDMPHLVRLAGEGAPEAARELLEQLRNVPAIADRLQQASRVDGRRWSLHLAGDVIVELPAEGVARALTDMSAGGAAAHLMTATGQIIDLRSPARIAVRPIRGA
jgi:cell division protein FtsQ